MRLLGIAVLTAVLILLGEGLLALLGIEMNFWQRALLGGMCGLVANLLMLQIRLSDIMTK